MANLRSYEYNALCPVCGFKYSSTEFVQRWDGLQVCKKCWEPRNNLDFYRPRDDTHKLPFIYSDNDGTNVGPTVNSNGLRFNNEVSRGTYAVASATAAASGLTYPVTYFIYNGTVTKIEKNGLDQQITSGTVYLLPVDTLAITYSVAPSFVRYR